MPLETATYISDLVVTNPANSDGLNQADDHMRLIKGALKNTFPAVSAPATRGPLAFGSHGFLADPGNAAAPAYSFGVAPSLGLYLANSVTGSLGIAGVLRGNGAVGVGSLHMFLVEPAGLGKGAVGTGHQYLELDGSTWPNSAFPDLAAHLGQGGTTFTLPDAKTLGRFPRSRTASVAAGTTQASQNKTHTHPVTGNTGGLNNPIDHLHSGTTGSMNRNNPHSHTYTAATAVQQVPASGGAGVSVSIAGANTGSTDINHEHAFTTGGADRSLDHTHPISITSGGGSADGAEARPEALSFVFCIKT